LVASAMLVFVSFLVVSYGGTQLVVQDAQHQVRVAEAAGEATNHSPNTIILGQYYGNEIAYPGWLWGSMWPKMSDVEAVEAIIGQQPHHGESYSNSGMRVLILPISWSPISKSSTGRRT